jgi:hypothetical protein
VIRGEHEALSYPEFPDNSAVSTIDKKVNEINMLKSKQVDSNGFFGPKPTESPSNSSPGEAHLHDGGRRGRAARKPPQRSSSFVGRMRGWL